MDTDTIQIVVANIIEQGKLILQLIAEETKLTIACIRSIIFLLFLSMVTIISSWLVILGCISYEVYKLSGNILYALASMLLVNIILLVIIKLILKFLKSSMTFKATRRQIFSIKEKSHVV